MSIFGDTFGASPSGGGGGSAPVITFISPTPSTTPGNPGGMPSSYSLAAGTPIVVSVTDADGILDIALLVVSVRFLDGSVDVVYRDGFFMGKYVAGSYLDESSSGYTLHVLRTGGWPGGTTATALAIEMLVDVSDNGGNAVTADVFFEMPTVAGIPNAPTPELAAIAAADVTSAAINRLIWQFRSS